MQIDRHTKRLYAELEDFLLTNFSLRQLISGHFSLNFDFLAFTIYVSLAHVCALTGAHVTIIPCMVSAQEYNCAMVFNADSITYLN